MTEIGWKKVYYTPPANAKTFVTSFRTQGSSNGCEGRICGALAKLEILRSFISNDYYSPSYRASKVKVLDIYSIPHKYRRLKSAYSGYDNNFVYKTGDILYEKNKTGIFYFKDRRQALAFVDWVYLGNENTPPPILIGNMPFSIHGGDCDFFPSYMKAHGKLYKSYAKKD